MQHLEPPTRGNMTIRESLFSKHYDKHELAEDDQNVMLFWNLYFKTDSFPCNGKQGPQSYMSSAPTHVLQFHSTVLPLVAMFLIRCGYQDQFIMELTQFITLNSACDREMANKCTDPDFCEKPNYIVSVTSIAFIQRWMHAYMYRNNVEDSAQYHPITYP